MEVVREKKLNVIVFILSIIFLFISVCVFGQNKMELVRDTEFENKKITILFPSYTMFFESKYDKKDTVFIGIKVDSINKNIVSPNLYAFVSKEEAFNHKKLIVEFEDGTMEVFKVVYNDYTERYVEYNFSKTAYSSLSNKKIISINFDNKSKYSNKDYESYFIDFLKLL